MPALQTIDNDELSESEDLARSVIKAFSNLTLENLDDLRVLYSEDVHFEDPAHGIQGLPALLAYLQALLANVKSCRFIFHHHAGGPSELFLNWTMILVQNGKDPDDPIRVEGASYLKFRDKRIYFHRDYFDLGAMVYENVPLLGRLIRAIRTRLGR